MITTTFLLDRITFYNLFLGTVNFLKNNFPEKLQIFFGAHSVPQLETNLFQVAIIVLTGSCIIFPEFLMKLRIDVDVSMKSIKCAAILTHCCSN